ncbi:putative membrane anchored protein with extracellular vWF domain and Ig-like domain [Halorhabdus sp. SVX81]|uniref:DUF58 domain-containing protein n=1 Tax=Halorhabdus sp. SVX81 TaxID=2978283 RepID=UPI0023DC14CE|nr:DUF58 domain-containing protein [Halorhabdus sp. SVX81]WEL18703.1 putative membrane anchored protein with extracellular vWF domain and Ig-like domain [Halorhabdus sp. SVX81]
MTGRTVDRVGRSESAFAATLLVAGIGFVAGSPFLLVAATVPLWYAAASVVGTEEDATVRATREVAVDGSGGDSDSTASSDEPLAGDPGDVVAVRTTVENAGSEPIVDLRVVDGVPTELPVIEGTPRVCVSLDAGEAVTLEYDLELQRGEHTFDPVTARTRDLTGTVVETWDVAATGADALSCEPPIESVPLRDGANDFAGTVPTDDGGSGVEFYAVRDYEPGDAVGSIDWRRYGRTRELTTVEYRAERATRIVCLVDARHNQFRGASRDRLAAAELSTDAAERTVETLVEAGHPTGVVAVADDDHAAVPPGTNSGTREAAATLLESARSSERLTNSRFWHFGVATDPFGEIEPSLPGEAQLYLFSSFVDDRPVELVERLRTRGYTVRVVSPDPVDGEGLERRFEAVVRRTRLARARSAGARVVDWDRTRPLGVVLQNAISGVRTR